MIELGIKVISVKARLHVHRWTSEIFRGEKVRLSSTQNNETKMPVEQLCSFVGAEYADG